MMSDQANWNSNQIEDCSGTRSSQDTICSQDHSGTNFLCFITVDNNMSTLC